MDATQIVNLCNTSFLCQLSLLFNGRGGGLLAAASVSLGLVTRKYLGEMQFLFSRGECTVEVGNRFAVNVDVVLKEGSTR